MRLLEWLPKNLVKACSWDIYILPVAHWTITYGNYYIRQLLHMATITYGNYYFLAENNSVTYLKFHTLVQMLFRIFSTLTDSPFTILSSLKRMGWAPPLSRALAASCLTFLGVVGVRRRETHGEFSGRRRHALRHISVISLQPSLPQLSSGR